LTAVDDPRRIDGDDSSGSPLSPRLRAAAVLRRLGHAIVAHDVDDESFDRLTTSAGAFLTLVEQAPPREPSTAGDLFAAPPPPQGGVRGNHFMDCIVTGLANPMGVAAETLRQGDDAVLRTTLGAAFEGAPGRAHGGMVAALFDEVMGFVLSIACTPAFTGRLTVSYRAPVPIGAPLEFRARLTGRDGRKLLMAGEARHDDALLAEAEALFVAVDPERFSAGRG
jgi:acyl-coenzyme A thioesterase PaaI-like protein